MPVVASRPSLAHLLEESNDAEACSSRASSSPRPRRSRSPPRRPARRPRPPPRRPRSPAAPSTASTSSGRRPHDRRRQPGVPALVRRRGEDEAVEGLRPVQRQGLRVGRRVRGRAAARLPEVQGQVDGRAVHELVPPGQEAVRLLPDPGLVHARAREGGGLLELVLLRQPVGRRPQGQADREGQVDRGPASRTSSARRSGRRATTTSSGSSAPRRARSSTTRTTPPSRRSRTARSTASSSTCRRRST